MKNTLKVLGIIAMVALIGFSMVSCSDDEGSSGGASFDGTWKGKYDITDDNLNVLQSYEITITIAKDAITIEGNGAKDEGTLGEVEETTTGYSRDITITGIDGVAGSALINDDGDKLNVNLSKGNVKEALTQGRAIIIWDMKK